MSERTPEERLEALIQRQLDGELPPTERAELAAILAEDPAARRRHEEYVALEGLLFAVGTTERTEGTRESAAAPPADRRRTAATSRARLVPALAVILLALLVLPRIVAPPGSPPSPSPRTGAVAAREDLRVRGLSEGHLAVALPCENPNVQIVWLYRTDSRPESRHQSRPEERTP